MSRLSIGLPGIAELVRLKLEVVVVGGNPSHARGEASYEHDPDRDDYLESKRCQRICCQPRAPGRQHHGFDC